MTTNLEQLIQQGRVPAQFTKQDYSAFHLSAKQHLSVIELENLLAQAQKGYDPRTDGVLIDYIAKLLTLEEAEGEQKAIRRRDENIINFISLLLDQAAKNAPDQAADLLLMLAIPFARLALKESDFFTSSTHPARETLSLLIGLSQSNIMPDKAFQILQFYITTITLRFSGQREFFSDINQQLEVYAHNFKFDLSQQLLQIEKQLDPKQKAANLSTLNKIYINELLKHLPQQLSITALTHYFIQHIFSQIGETSQRLHHDWLNADRDISRFLDLFNRRNLTQFKEAHKQLADHVKSFNKYLQEIQIPLSLRRLFFEQAQQLLQLVVKGQSLDTLQDTQLKHSEALNHEADLLLQAYPSTLGKNTNFGYANQASHNAFTLGQAADASSIVKLRMGQWANIMIDGKRTPCQICFYSSQRQSFYFCSQTHQQLFERSGGDFVVDLQMGFAELLVRCNDFDAIFDHVVAYLEHYQSR